MTDHWNQHQIEFLKKNTPTEFPPTEASWEQNETGFTIDTEQELTEQELTEEQMDNRRKERREVYKTTDPDVANLRKRNEYTNQVRSDSSYRFLMMVAAFSKKKIGTVINVTQQSKENSKEDNSWMTMPEITGSIQLTPEIYGHLKEAEMIVNGYIKNKNIKLKTLVEDSRYSTLFARLVAIRLGLTSYFDSSDKQKDRIFSRLHQEQTMLLRRLSHIKINPITTHYHRA